MVMVVGPGFVGFTTALGFAEYCHKVNAVQRIWRVRVFDPLCQYNAAENSVQFSAGVYCGGLNCFSTVTQAKMDSKKDLN